MNYSSFCEEIALLYKRRYKNMKTLKNKLYAIALLVCGSLGVALENDATALVLFGMIAVPLFFAKENWIC